MILFAQHLSNTIYYVTAHPFARFHDFTSVFASASSSEPDETYVTSRSLDLPSPWRFDEEREDEREDEREERDFTIGAFRARPCVRAKNTGCKS